MLLVAVGRDANNQMFPLAWAVVEGENNASWELFLGLLKRCLQETSSNGWTLISDQQKGLENVVASIFPEAEYRNCPTNWHKVYKGYELKGLFWKAARAYNETYFTKTLEEMKEVSPAAVEAFLC